MTITVHIDRETTEASSGESLFELAERVGVRLPTSCFKSGRCRECLIEIIEGGDRLSARSEEENFSSGDFRLACRAKIIEGDGVVRCRGLRRSALQIEESTVRAERMEMEPALGRDGLRVLLDDELLAERSGPIHGVAVDLGTTTIVLRLVDLESGRIIATRSFENPQRFGGSDIMSRIHYDGLHGGRLLQRALLRYLSAALEDLGCDPLSIYEIVVAGNPTMRDLFFGLDVQSVGQSPYRSVTEQEMIDGKRSTTALTATASSLKLPVFPDARVYGLPLLRSHVGADTTADLLAIDMEHEDGLVLLLDIGTNTEVAVGNRHRLIVASCPAGPAFEGGLIGCGMPGLEGAIESLKILDSGRVEYEVIGGLAAEGVCGSGLVDLLSELLRTGKMNDLGRYTDDANEFVIDSSRDLRLSEEDISQLAQAKGATVAGIEIVLGRFGVQASDLDRVVLAGGFARHISIDAARRIGLIPDLPDEKFVRIGNASLEGSYRALCSRTERHRAEALAARAEHVSLETDEGFFDAFVDGCMFQPQRVPKNWAPKNSRTLEGGAE